LDWQLDTVAPFIKGSALAFVKHKQQVKQSASQSACQERGAIRLSSVEIADDESGAAMLDRNSTDGDTDVEP
jgi:hypothetical protein